MLKINAYKNLSLMSFDVLIRDTGTFNRVAEPVSLVLRPHEEFERVEPTLRLDLDLAQELFQSMWDQGYRPVNGSNGKAEVEAQQKHIAFAEGVAHTLLAHIQK